ncbi:MAG TPA: hypothetical protein PLY68_05135 [Myxococcota bacterium]|nr:hypothetical protein [Myxococcota bacterium]HNZ02593.1 hypothetical protein [Myxococcota bacterium]HOD07782.1 hypothetical protein [Myxococcota bacterium]HPB49802.1 hypothetical protein [Myxococcota bacterium]HQP95563.1 hypothetical protein [Myxococcota bacterium]
MMNRFLSLAVLSATVWLGCAQEQVGGDEGGLRDQAETDVPGLPADRGFSQPEGVAFWNDRVFVTNANFAYQGAYLAYGEGFLTVVDASEAVVLNMIGLPFENPQEAVVSGDRLWVLCSGLTSFDGEVRPVTSGGLCAFDLDGIDTAVSPSVVIPLPNLEGTLVGYPSGIVVKDGLAWVGSGTVAALFVVDLESGTVVRGASNPVFLGPGDVQNTTVVSPGPDGLLMVGLFNDDKVLLLDPVGWSVVDEPWGPIVVGQTGLLDGLLDIEFDGTTTYLLMALANQVLSFDTAAGPAAGVRKLARNMLTPNRMKVLDGNLYVVNSGSNSLSVVDTVTGDVRTLALPVNCSPWDLALEPSARGVTAWVSCLKLNRLVAVDTTDGSLREVE